MKKRVLWLLILMVVGVGLMLGGAQLGSAHAAGASRIGLVIAYGDGTVKSKCISLSAEKMSGLDVLKASGLPLEISYDSSSAAVCKIGNVGCPVDNCFCDSPPNFWAYWHLKDANWLFSQLGASSYSVSDGDVEGWVWGPGQSNPPTQASFDQICTALPTPTEAPTTASTEPPTITPTIAPTPTRKPTRTQAPTTVRSASTQAPDQSTDTPEPIEPAQQLEQPAQVNTSFAGLKSIYLPLVSDMEDLPEDTQLTTELADNSTPATVSQTPPSSSSPLIAYTPQPGQDDPTEVPGSNTAAGSYFFLGVIVAGLGIGLYVVTHKKWK
jgi:hypothetical protein